MNSLDNLLSRINPQISAFILELRKFVLQLSGDIEEEFTDKMITYKTIVIAKHAKKRRQGLLWFNLSNGSVFRLHLRKNGHYDDTYNRLVPEGWGGYPEITFRENELDGECLEYVKSLIQKAFEQANPGEMNMPNTVKETIQEILDLQPQWKEKSPEMDKRGDLVRNRIPQLLENLLAGSVPATIPDFRIGGRDGIGKKARIPWTRIYSRKYSPNATDGWYVSLLFSFDGSAVYLSLNQGAREGKGNTPKNPADLSENVNWARNILGEHKADVAGLLNEISLEDPGSGRSYEQGNVYAFRYARAAVPEDEQIRNK